MENPSRWTTRAVFISAIAPRQLPTKTQFDGTKLPVAIRRPETTTYGMKLLSSLKSVSQNRAHRNPISFQITLDTRPQAPDFA
jgi:hypothetical protein